ncbi:hypothetical protein KFK09_014963 [Dendrobium nobile]|uniref:rRNA-processing protein FYV7 n=1 Tax=Dendrobium nobile TaxID=94219 RepID=A0A8T3B9B1_DENNO|nr:hypothetical protein KFK09_014963 [Dendrobium nobile]
MKKREDFNQVGFRGGDYIRNRKKNEKRIGGKALSLAAFANAKSRPSGYNPSFIKKQREFYRNAKCINKFKKSVKRDSQFEERRHSLPNIEATNEDDENVLKSRKINKKKKTSLKALGEEVEEKRAEAEKLRMEREAMIQAKKEERAKAEAKRKFLRDNMSKRTRSGQPVMKYRIQHILEGLLEKQ